MNCAEMENLLPELAEGLEPSAEARTHLEQCASCRETLESFEDLWGAMDGVPSIEDASPPMPEILRQDLRAIEKARRWSPLLWLAGGIVGLAMTRNNLRPDLGELSMIQGVGPAILFFGLAALALHLGLRLSGLGFRRGVSLLSGIALLFLLYIALFSGEASSAPSSALEEGASCLTAGLMMAAPILIVAAWLLRKAHLPTVLSATVLGTGAGLVATGILQLHCPISTTSHLLFFHGGALLATALIPGALAAWWTHRGMQRKVKSR